MRAKTVYRSIDHKQTPAQRKKAALDRLRSRATYDLPADLISAVEDTALAEGIPNSQLAAALMIAGLDLLMKGELNLQKRPCRSPLYEWLLDLPAISKRT